MKCKHWKKCKLYSNDSRTCNVDGGVYYQDRYSGCYMLMERKNEKTKEK
jgi:hypothetical protein